VATTPATISNPIALTIAGSDSGGGAGIQADLKTFSALGVYGASVITAVTAQNTRAVTAVQEIDPAVIDAQIQAVLADLNIAAVKIGMLSSAPIIDTVASALQSCRAPLVLDPVMIAKSGDALLHDDAVTTLRDILLPMAKILTPNLPEAARLLETSQAANEQQMQEQGQALLALGAGTVLMKGGHAKGDQCVDLLIQPGQAAVRLVSQRIDTNNTHGTGCTLSAAIAAGLAKYMALTEAVQQAHEYLAGAIRAADSLAIGQGNGPVHHFYRQW